MGPVPKPPAGPGLTNDVLPAPGKLVLFLTMGSASAGLVLGNTLDWVNLLKSLSLGLGTPGDEPEWSDLLEAALAGSDHFLVTSLSILLGV